MTAQPVWFGPEDRPLAGFLHLPETEQCLSGVVICPPLGREHVLSYAQLRALAGDLAARGHLVLRFDYDGMGDSDGGLGDPHRLSAWTTSIEQAVGHLLLLGVAGVDLVGLRLGALLAVRAAGQLGAVDRLVLWDPQVRGSHFLREQTMLAGIASAGVTPLDDGSVHTFGSVFPPDVAGDLKGLRLVPPPRPLARRLLVVTRPQAALDEALTGAMAPQVDVVTSTEQEGLLESDPPRLAVQAADAIACWLGSERSPTTRPVSSRLLAEQVDHAPSAVVHDRQGGRLVERPWRSASGLLYGVLSEPLPGHELPGAPTVVLLPPGTWHRIGLGRMWVDVARECAVAGVRAVRLDLSGLGDSEVRPGQLRDVVYAPEAVEDLVQAGREIDVGHGIRLVGHCSGAWTALEAAQELRPVSVHAVGAPAYVDLAEWRAQVSDPTRPPAPPTRAQRLHSRVLATGKRPGVERFRFAVPEWVWAAGDRTGVLVSPARRLQALLDAGTEVHLISDVRDGIWWLAEGRAWMRRARQDSRFTARSLPLIDHQLATAFARREVGRLLREQLIGAAGRESPAEPVEQPSAPPVPEQERRSQAGRRAKTRS